MPTRAKSMSGKKMIVITGSFHVSPGFVGLLRSLNNGFRLGFRRGRAFRRDNWRHYVFPQFLDRSAKAGSAHNGLAKTGYAVRSFIRSLFRRLRSAMLMHFNKRSRTFRYWSFFMVRSAACASFHLPKSLQLPSQVLRVDVYFEPARRVQ